MSEMRERTGCASSRADHPSIATLEAAVEPVVATHAASDPRVGMVLEVLGGRAVDDVAHDWQLEPQLIHRWLRDFLVAGASRITNRPEPDEAARRDRFMAAWAHELRTPVSVARGWLALLADGDVPADEHAATVARANEALTRLTEQILDGELGSSASLGRLCVAPERLDLDALCRELPGCAGVRRGADEAVFADPRLLRRVLRDLWRTAHRDPLPDAVVVDVVADDAWHEIRVERRGEPISASMIRTLFDPFGSTNDDTTGVTTGLYLARALTVAHGGVLGAEGEERTTVLSARIPRVAETNEEDTTQTATPVDPGPTRFGATIDKGART